MKVPLSACDTGPAPSVWELLLLSAFWPQGLPHRAGWELCCCLSGSQDSTSFDKARA